MSKNHLVLILTLLGISVACSPAAPTSSTSGGLLKVVATTGMIGNAVEIIGGDAIQVDTLMGPGVDPHLYKASEGDVQRLTGADLIFYNGLHLEGKMTDIFVKLASRRPIIAVAAELDESRLREPPEFAGQYDPHVWFDVELWAGVLEPITDALAAQLPDQADQFRERAEAYRNELLELDRWAEQRVSEIPEDQRILVTAHDAFGYFGRRYGMRVVGIQGLSTLSEAGLRDIGRVVDAVEDSGISAIFIESSVPRRAIEAVLAACRDRGAEVVIGGELFSDAMGSPDSAEGSYIGMVRHNVNTIVEALK